MADPQKIANSQISIVMKKGAEVEYFTNFFCNVVCYLMHSITSIILCSKFDFIAIYLILANFTAFLDHTKENADVSKNDGFLG